VNSPGDTTGIRVFLVDDHEIVRRGVAELIEAESDLRVVGDAGSVAEALVRIPLSRPQVAVLDVRLPDGNGVELCRELRDAIPALGCLMLTSFADDQAMLDAVLTGAGGYVLKNIRGNDFVTAIRTVAAGGSMLDPRAVELVRQRLRAPSSPDVLAQLSEQERRILALIGEGMTNRQIAAELFLAEKTVKNYVSNVLAKLGLQRRTQVAVLATELRQSAR